MPKNELAVLELCVLTLEAKYKAEVPAECRSNKESFAIRPLVDAICASLPFKVTLEDRVMVVGKIIEDKKEQLKLAE